MQLDIATRQVHTRVPFRIARGESSTFTIVEAVLHDTHGIAAHGEAAPSAFFGESVDTVIASLEASRDVLTRADDWSIDAVHHALAQCCPDMAARAALSAASYDRLGKQAGKPLWSLLGIEPRNAPRSSFTIGLAPDLDTLTQRVRQAVEEGYPILKVKLGGPNDEAAIRCVRAAGPSAELRVDANAGWTVSQALAMLDVLADVNVVSLEQPVAVSDLAALRTVRDAASIPVIADEACRTESDVVRLADCVDGVNIKLGKCGGLREAQRMIGRARALGLRVMVGCRIESSLGITAAAQLAGLIDDADLDGAALLADDPYDGATIANGVIRLPDRPGLGVQERIRPG
jgi:L-Ala-D/L-Glu epimerase